MRRVRLTMAALLPLLLVGFMFTACEEDKPTDVGGGTGGTPGNDGNVHSITLTVGTSDLVDYFGKTDSVSVTVTAKDVTNDPVTNATIALVILNGPGRLILNDGNVTDDNGQVKAKFVHTLNRDTSSTIQASVNQRIQTKQINIDVQDIRVIMTATPASQEVITDESGQSTLKIRVQNTAGVVVEGVPISMQLISGAGVLTPPYYDLNQNAYISTVVVDAVDELVETTVRAYVDPGADIIEGGGGGGGGNGKWEGPGENVIEPQVEFVGKGKGNRQVAASVTADTIVVRMIPSNSRVSHIFIRANPKRMVVAPGESQQSEITLVAYDENNNGVANIQLYVRPLNLIEGDAVGSVSSPALTDLTGMTLATLSTNLSYGTWVLQASSSRNYTTVFTDTVSVVTGSAQQISVAADTTRLAVFGTNGIEFTQIRARVRDENGNSVQDGSKVFFLLNQFPWEDGDPSRIRLGSSDGMGSPYDDPWRPGSEYGLPFDSATTNSGEASITIRSGSRKGQLSLRAWTYLDPERTQSILADYNGLQIVAGPPEYIELSFDPEGARAGGGTWVMEVSGRVQDILNNDVEAGHQVQFSVVETIAHVTDGVTGNSGPNTSDPSPGMAYASLFYQSHQTNKWITLKGAIIRGSDGARWENTYTLQLPIQQPTGELFVSPNNFNYTLHTPHPGYARIELTLFVTDGYGNLIDDQLVHFSPQVGRIFTTNVMPLNTPQTPYAYTGTMEVGGGVDGDPQGVSKRWLLLTEDEAFPDPTALVATCTINAYIVGSVDSAVDPKTIFLYR